MINHRKILKKVLPYPVQKFIINREVIKVTKKYLKEQGFKDFKVSQNREKEYEKRYQEIIKRYKQIYFYEICATAIGAFGPSIALLKHDYKRKEEFLHVFIPLPLDNKGEIFIPNKVLLSMCKEEMIVSCAEELDFWKYVYSYHSRKVKLNHFGIYHPGNYECGRGEKTPYEELRDKDIFHFNSEQIEVSENEMKKMGIGSSYVCLFMRDQAYVSQKRGWNDYGGVVRNSSFETYKKAVDLILEQKLQLVRMGQVVECEIKYKSIVDFAYNHYSELLDVYLFSKCLFYLGDVSGVIALPQIFHKPIAICNLTVITQRGDIYGLFFEDRDIYIPQKLYSEKEQRYLTLKEQLELEKESIDYTGLLSVYSEKGIRWVKNTAEEIEDLAIEMLGKINQKYIYSMDDKENQKKYKEILLEAVGGKLIYYIRARISSKFLNKNPWYLE